MGLSGSPPVTIVVVCVCLAGYSVAACGNADDPETGFEEFSGSGGDGSTTNNGAGGIPTATGTVSTGSSSPTTSTSSSMTTSSTTTTGTGQPCNDSGEGEPGNDSESGAVDLGTLGDNDGSNTVMVQGVLAGASDVDWYTYHGDDGPGGIVDPTRSLSSSEQIRICKFFQCPDNDESFDCPGGTSHATSPSGRPGCCAGASFTVNLECGGTFGIGDDSADVFIRLDQAPASSCPTYTATIHY